MPRWIGEKNKLSARAFSSASLAAKNSTAAYSPVKFPNTSIGDAVVGIGPLTRSIGWGIADPPVNTKYSFLATSCWVTVCILLACTLGVATTFLLGSAIADAQNASAISATPHRPIQPTRRDSLNGVFISALCSISGHNTMTIAINFLPLLPEKMLQSQLPQPRARFLAARSIGRHQFFVNRRGRFPFLLLF